MIFTQSRIPDVFVVEPEPLSDNRGFFARAFCEKEFTKAGLVDKYVQCNMSYNEKKATTRGMHFQIAPHEEVKVVRCTSGAIFDVVVDFREDSPTYLQWFGTELSATNRKMLYVPKGFAHGYQTLTDGAEVFYHVSEFYSPEADSGLFWQDPDIAIDWPFSEHEVIISEKDASWPLIKNRLARPCDTDYDHSRFRT